MSGGVTLVLFGATGDLSQKMLLPALFRLYCEGRFDDVNIVGVARSREHDDSSFRRFAIKAAVREAEQGAQAADWSRRLHYHSLGEGTADDFDALVSHVASIERRTRTSTRLVYIATPPAAYRATIEGIAGCSLIGRGTARIAIEKPFGTDYESARVLNQRLHQIVSEERIYRADHFLSIDAVTQLSRMRFANPMLEAIWSRDHVTEVQITIAESIGVGDRADFYEATGVVRDMMQNHLTQLAAVVAMERPASPGAEDVAEARLAAIRSMAPLDADSIVVGQYAGGEIAGERVVGYLDEKGVAPATQTPTYAAARLELTNDRWNGVPFHLRTGKRLGADLWSVQLLMRRGGDDGSNRVTFRIQPHPSFELQLISAAGDRFMMTESLDCSGDTGVAPYASMLEAFVSGDRTRFVSCDETEASWALWDPLLRADLPLHPYWSGTDGPAAAHALLRRRDHAWVARLEQGAS